MGRMSVFHQKTEYHLLSITNNSRSKCGRRNIDQKLEEGVSLTLINGLEQT